MSASDMWMPLYIGDYLADTVGLTTEQHGAYLLPLMEHWRRGSLPASPDRLAAIVRVSRTYWKRRLADAILPFFRRHGDQLGSDNAGKWRFWTFGRLNQAEWRRLREAVLDRDGDAPCAYCGQQNYRMECDHIVPLSRGGTNDLANLVMACQACNRSKGARRLEECRP